QREGLGPPVSEHANDRLEQGRGELEGERNQADLAEVETISLLDEGIDGRQERLHHVVEQVRKAQRQDNGERGFGDDAQRPSNLRKSWLLHRPSWPVPLPRGFAPARRRPHRPVRGCSTNDRGKPYSGGGLRISGSTSA